LVSAETRLEKPLPRYSCPLRLQYSGFQADGAVFKKSVFLYIVVTPVTGKNMHFMINLSFHFESWHELSCYDISAERRHLEA
jgi:hypothetical protein